MIAQPGDSRGLQTAANPSLSNNREEVCGQRKSSGSNEDPTQRGQAPSIGQVQNICEHRQEEGNKAMCNGGKYRSKMGSPAWQPRPVTMCYIRHKLILIKYLTAELPLLSVEMKWFAVCSKRCLQSWHLRLLQENGCCQ